MFFYKMSILSRVVLLFSIFFWTCAEEQEDMLKPNPENQFSYFSRSKGLVNNEVTTLYEDKSGKIWIGTANGISVYNGTSFTNYTTEDGLIEGSILSISHDSQGDVWAGTEEGYAVFDGQAWETEYGIGVSALHLDDDNTFWIGTYGFGLLEWKENGQLNNYSSSQCGLCDYYTRIFEDQTGEIWFSTFGGAVRFDDGNLILFDISQGVSQFLTAGACDSWDNTWFGSIESEKFYRINGSKVSQVDFPTGYTSVTGMVNRKDILYIATHGSGLLYYDGTVVRKIIAPKEDLNLLALLADSKGNLWIGTADNGLIRLKVKDKI